MSASPRQMQPSALSSQPYRWTVFCAPFHTQATTQILKLWVGYVRPEKTQHEKWEDLNSHLSKEDTQMAKKYIRRCLAALIIREMWIKTTVRHHFTQIRMTIKNRWEIDGRKEGREGRQALEGCRETCASLMVLQGGVAAVKNSKIFALQKFKHRTTIWSSYPNPGYIPQRIKSRHSDRYILMLIEALFTVAKSESNLTAHQEKNGWIKCGILFINIQENIIQHERRKF